VVQEVEEMEQVVEVQEVLEHHQEQHQVVTQQVQVH
tara:strand:- start:609 stop:716 length:108 start_codon:yes stop_codon:yes gene_type:complete